MHNFYLTLKSYNIKKFPSQPLYLLLNINLLNISITEYRCLKSKNYFRLLGNIFIRLSKDTFMKTKRIVGQ